MLRYEGRDVGTRHRVYKCDAGLYSGAVRIGDPYVRREDCNTAIDMETGERVEKATFWDSKSKKADIVTFRLV